MFMKQLTVGIDYLLLDIVQFNSSLNDYKKI